MNRYNGNHKQEFMNWQNNIIAAITKLNEVLGCDLTGEGFLNLEYRGRSHHVVLTQDGIIIARGMYAITESIKGLLYYYHLN